MTLPKSTEQQRPAVPFSVYPRQANMGDVQVLATPDTSSPELPEQGAEVFDPAERMEKAIARLHQSLETNRNKSVFATVDPQISEVLEEVRDLSQKVRAKVEVNSDNSPESLPRKNKLIAAVVLAGAGLAGYNILPFIGGGQESRDPVTVAPANPAADIELAQTPETTVPMPTTTTEIVKPIPLTTEQINQIADEAGISAERLLRSNGVFGTEATATKENLEVLDGGVRTGTSEDGHEFTMRRIEEGEIGSLLALAVATADGKPDTRHDLLKELEVLNPDGFKIGVWVKIPARYKVPTVLQAANLMDEGCTVPPRSGDNAKATVNLEIWSEQIAGLVEKCGRDLTTVEAKIEQLNPGVTSGQDVKGSREIIVPFGQKIVDEIF